MRHCELGLLCPPLLSPTYGGLESTNNPFSHSAHRKTGRDQRWPNDISEQGGTEGEQTRRNDNNSPASPMTIKASEMYIGLNTKQSRQVLNS